MTNRTYIISSVDQAITTQMRAWGVASTGIGTALNIGDIPFTAAAVATDPIDGFPYGSLTVGAVYANNNIGYLRVHDLITVYTVSGSNQTAFQQQTPTEIVSITGNVIKYRMPRTAANGTGVTGTVRCHLPFINGTFMGVRDARTTNASDIFIGSSSLPLSQAILIGANEEIGLDPPDGSRFLISELWYEPLVAGDGLLILFN